MIPPAVCSFFQLFPLYLQLPPASCTAIFPAVLSNVPPSIARFVPGLPEALGGGPLGPRRLHRSPLLPAAARRAVLLSGGVQEASVGSDSRAKHHGLKNTCLLIQIGSFELEQVSTPLRFAMEGGCRKH